MISNFDGITDNNKPSSKVLRPPGGGSSDIFGSDMPQTPRSVKNRMVSNIFTAEKDGANKNNGDAPRRGQKNVDSYSRLFGEPARPITPGKNHMKSSIAFGQNGEAAQQLLTNGNGHNGHYSGKSGSVSSASSSVSSSTENLKMNGGSRSVFRNMSRAQNIQEPPPLERDPACLLTPIPSAEPVPPADVLDIDLPCVDDGDVSDVPEDNQTFTESDKRDVRLQTRRDLGTNPERPYSLDKMDPPPNLKEPLGPCQDYIKEEHMPCDSKDNSMCARNPITGSGLNGDGVGGLKFKKPRIREGNPVTGEGYSKSGNDMPAASVNGANQVINKNRVPPGGYSSGLW